MIALNQFSFERDILHDFMELAEKCKDLVKPEDLQSVKDLYIVKGLRNE